MAFLFVPNGVNMAEWKPTKTGSFFELSPTLEPLEAVKNDVLVLSGLTHDKGRANGDGAGGHARAASAFLTGSQALKSEGANIRLGQSVDQYAAGHFRDKTRFASIEIGTEQGRPYGKCDSGYSCGYSNNISWRDAQTPAQKIVNPRDLFERLFGPYCNSASERERSLRARYRRSVLDVVRQDARSLEHKLGKPDQQKLDEYFTSIREIEQRIERAENLGVNLGAIQSLSDRIPEEPLSVREHIRLLGDLMVLAFQTDSTRVCSYMFANAGSNRKFEELEISDGHHSISHHQGNRNNLRQIGAIDRFYVQQFAYVLEKMKSVQEGDSTLLDNSLVVYGSGISDGNRHNSENLPLLLAGRGGSTVTSGRHIEFGSETPVCNLFNSMLDRAGVPVDFFGDSTGRLADLRI